MSYLALCIPNYNRLEELKRLICASAEQIMQNALEKEVEICISDDCSPENPTQLVQMLQEQYPQVMIRYSRNEQNRGMDYNFLQSVLIADSQYCWIIGNDDMPAEDGIGWLVNYLKEQKDSVDILLTPFDVYGSDNKLRTAIYPLGSSAVQIRRYDTGNEKDYERFLLEVEHNSGLFGFLSNTVFKRERWLRYQEQFRDKLGTIFIQMYMNIQTLQDGAKLEYVPNKIIKNYADDEMNESADRFCNVLCGLNGVIEFFFEGSYKEHLLKAIIDHYITAVVWDQPEESRYKQVVRNIQTQKNELYRKYFVPSTERKSVFFQKKVVLYGAGNFGKKAYKELERQGADILAVIDANPFKQGMEFGRHLIQSREELEKLYTLEQPVVVVANHGNLVDIVTALLEDDIRNIAIIT